MKLMMEEELIMSTVVANNRMNRERNASGVNSYEKDINFHPEKYIGNHLQIFKQIKWLDLCCGEGKALLQCALYLADNNLQHKATLKGIDLIDAFQPIPSKITCLQWQVGSVVNLSVIDERYDIITCVHGLHYVGDKLQVIQKACSLLGEHGIFLAHLDLQNIKVIGESTPQLIKKRLIEMGIHYDMRKKILSCNGSKMVEFGLQYQGADDKAGPNYTGQEAVNSYYCKL
ncbi:class I SAM-dependent methyltransferase [Chitinophagaceae bacterium LWZ2-11]